MKQEIIDGNKLIAEFDGGIYDPVYEQFMFEKDGERNWVKPDDLQYHTSWDWVMPVWGKCKEIGLWMMLNGYDKLWLEKAKEIENAIINELDCAKAATKLSQLIEWYNETKSTN